MSVLEHYQVAEISISYQPKVKASERAIASTSTDAYKVFLSQWSHLISYIEEFNVLFLNQGNKVIGFFIDFMNRRCLSQNRGILSLIEAYF